MHCFRLDAACKVLVVTITTVTLLGCATVKDIASQTPIISMAYDGLQAYQLIDLATQDDSMTDEEVRAMMNRPLPKPPGISYTVALLRRAGAALALGETRVVEDAYQQARANQVSPELQNSILELVVMGHAGNGDIKKARAISLDLEKAYRLEAQKGGLAPNVWPGKHAAFYGMMLAVSSGMGDRQLFYRLMNEYPPDLDAVPKLSESSRALYVLSRKTMMYSLLSEEGDYEGALIAAKECQQIQERRIASASGSDRKHLVGSTITMHRQVSEMNSLLRRPDAALQHVKSMRDLTPDTDSAQMARSNIHAAEATHLASIGHYEEALRNFDISYTAMLRVFKSQKVVQESYMRDRARLQVASGKYPDALATIERLGSLDSMSISHYRTSLVALRAFARAASGQTTQDLSPLDALDKEMSKRIGTDSARFHFAVSTYTHLAAFKGNKRENSLRQSIRSGRLFSDSYKKLRSTGQYGDVFTPKDVFDRAKAAYLMATLSSVGKWDVSIDDVLDAFSLYYDSITDEDVSSAALRAGIPGLTDAEVRALLDLRVAARRDAKNLEVISRSAERVEIERAAETSERARRAFDSEVARLGMKAPGLANIVGIHPPQLGDIRKELLPFEALVALAPTPDGTGALIIARNRLAYRWLPIASDKLDSLINKIRLTTRISQTSSRAPRFAAAAAHELYQELMSWASPDLRGLRQLSVVSRGSLSSIPFGLLVTSAPEDRQYRDMDWLIRDYAVSQVPSITSWMLAARGARKAPRTLSFVAWADPDFGGTRPTVQVVAGPKVRGSVQLRNAKSAANSPTQSLAWSDELKDLDPLPDTLDEAIGIANVLGVSPGDTILAGRSATRRSVMSMSASGQLATKNIVLFATHGLTPSDLGGRIQQPALAMSLDSADRAPPLLTLEDVMELRMNAEWVLLSACNTASADSIDGDAISGLARGFIFAGAKSLLATHWSVESESSKALTQAVMSKYQSTPSLTRAQALQAASLSLIDGQNVAADWTHPVFWAPFSLVGNGQR